MKTESVKVLRPFFWKGQPTKAGDVLSDVPATFAAELVSAKKAERVAATGTQEATKDASKDAGKESTGGKNAR